MRERAGRRLAVVGAGWAGLAAAVTAVQHGAEVVLFEMARQAGGRARDLGAAWPGFDNGQHICIGAYTETLRLLRAVGVDPDAVFLRAPLTLVEPEGAGLRLPGGPPTLAFAIAVLRRGGWSWRDKAALLALAWRWQAAGFQCAASATVAQLTAALPQRVREAFIEPLCVAALNTPADAASGTVFLRVLRDSLHAGRGSADLLLPRQGLSEILPEPTLAWLGERSGEVRLGRRVERLDAEADRVMIDGEAFGAAVVAASALEAARLLSPVAAGWAAQAASFAYEPIVTVYASSAGCRLPEPMLALPSDAERPAQFVFDRGQLGGAVGLLAFVISGAAPWAERGSEATTQATLRQAAEQLRPFLLAPLEPVRTVIEKRATFRCVPGLRRPPLRVAERIFAAGDYIEGPYPATLEGAVRSGAAAACAALAEPGPRAVGENRS